MRNLAVPVVAVLLSAFSPAPALGVPSAVQAIPPGSEPPKSRPNPNGSLLDEDGDTTGSPQHSATNAPSKPVPDAALNTAIRARDYIEIDRIVEARLARGDRDPLMLYHGACALAQLGRNDAAEKRLLDAVKAGFRDFDTIETDPDLEPIRASQTYETIMDARERLERTENPERPRAPRRQPIAEKVDPLSVWQRDHGDRYRYERDSERGLVYATFLEDASHARMKQILDELGTHLVDAYFEKPPDEPVLVAIVRAEDSRKYLDRDEVRGMYLHDARRLVARDIGQSLQHEFVHLMHFAHMERTGQRHPIWIQEGLASLYENYTVHPDGSFEFIPNVRFNIARKQVISRTAKPWKELFALEPKTFMADAERAYPQVRAIFEFIARENKLKEFYRALCATSVDDPDGSSALERVFGVPIARIEERWKKWMIDRGSVDDSVSRKDASLGLTVDEAGDGVRIRSFVLRSAAKSAGLRIGDTIFAIDGRRVANQEELILAVARLEIGRSIRVDYRRDGRELSVEVTPRPLGE